MYAHIFMCGFREPLQTRDALVAILKELHEEDHFALVLFDDKISTWKDFLTKATHGNVTKAIAYVKKLRDNGCKRKSQRSQLLGPFFFLCTLSRSVWLSASMKRKFLINKILNMKKYI